MQDWRAFKLKTDNFGITMIYHIFFGSIFGAFFRRFFGDFGSDFSGPFSKNILTQ